MWTYFKTAVLDLTTQYVPLKDNRRYYKENEGPGQSMEEISTVFIGHKL